MPLQHSVATALLQEVVTHGWRWQAFGLCLFVPNSDMSCRGGASGIVFAGQRVSYGFRLRACMFTDVALADFSLTRRVVDYILAVARRAPGAHTS